MEKSLKGATVAELFTVKYKPRKLNEIVGNDKAVKQFIGWLKGWKSGSKAALLYGPPGVGKTLTVEVAAKELGYDLVQLNASDVRTAEAIMRVAGTATRFASLLGGKRLIFFDEVDGISGSEDKGGLGAIIEVLKKTQVPVVLAANDPWDPRLRPLRQYCEMIRFNRVGVTSLVAFLRRVCQAEGVKADNDALRVIASIAEGDVRAALNDLQVLIQGKRTLTVRDVEWIKAREKELGAFDVLKAIFSARNATEAKSALDSSRVDYEMVLEWIHENLPYQYTDPEELAKAYDALSRADVYLGVVKRRQRWELLSYALELMSIGVAMAKRGRYRFVKYQFPQRIIQMGQTKYVRELRDRICATIASKCHVSRKVAASELLPYVKLIFENSEAMRENISRWLQLTDEEREFLMGGVKLEGGENAKADG
ncbi:MAG: replication factor C large subunit [Candidatus Nezhaarchaeales archaeon]